MVSGVRRASFAGIVQKLSTIVLLHFDGQSHQDRKVVRYVLSSLTCRKQFLAADIGNHGHAVLSIISQHLWAKQDLIERIPEIADQATTRIVVGSWRSCG